MNIKQIIRTALAALTAAITFVPSSNAQISYVGYMLNIGDAPRNENYDLLIKMKSMKWSLDNNRYFNLDVTPTSPRLSGGGDKVVFYNTDTKTFNDIEVASVYNLSDARAKTNVHTLSDGLEAVLNLRPVSYSWAKSDGTLAKSAMIATGDSITEYNLPAGANATQYGFLAQEVEQVIPNIVKTGDGGTKMVNYTALIPMLVQSIQELHAVVEQQNAVIENLSAVKFNAASVAPSDCLISCSPNPTRGDMTFAYSLADGTESARIVITNLSGLQKKSVACDLRATAVTTSLSALQPGVYIATLVVDNAVKDSKQIVVAD